MQELLLCFQSVICSLVIRGLFVSMLYISLITVIAVAVECIVSVVRSHWDAICTQDNDHAGDEKFRGCSPSHLEQFTSRSANCNSLPSDVGLTFEGPPVWLWLIGSASEDYL